MKKLFLLLAIASLLLVSNKTQAQTPVQNSILKVINAYDIAASTTSVIIPFFENYNVSKIGMQVDYINMTGDSAHVNCYVSANGTTWSNIVSNYTNTRWVSGAGGTKTYFDNIDVSAYPVGFIKVAIDTCTGLNNGKVTVYVKPYFK